MAVCLAGHDGSQVVGADPDVGGVGHTSGSVGHGVTQGSVGGSDSTISEGVASVAVASIAQVVAKTVRVTVVGIVSLGIGLSLSLSIGGPLAVVVAVGVMSVAVVRNISLGGRVKALGDWVQTCARSEGDTGVSIRITITKNIICNYPVS